MPLSWNEIRDRAVAFVREWENETSEDAEAKSFWDAFFQVFGVHRRRLASFEHNVRKASGAQGFIDLFWPGILIAEHKSRGKNLDSAFTQATDYFPGLKDAELPRYIIVSDFARIRLRNLDSGEEAEFPLTDLPKNLALFGFIAGYESRAYREQDPVNIKAAERLAALHDALREIGYEGHVLEVFLVRILFCLFADDTGIFMPRSAFEDFIQARTSEDGSDLAPRLHQLFQTLNTPPEKRLKNLDEQVAAFPYVNGRLFAEQLPQASFDRAMRETVLACCELDWGVISPAIFGSLFQGIMDAKMRRNLGAHYTSEKNILKLIGPLFMDDLHAEFERIKSQPARLKAFHDKLGALNFFDPACGCGNFLVISYREVRLLELEVIKRLYGKELQQLSLDAIDQYVKVNVDQFHGIEIEEWPAQIAQVAMWLIDHQMNLLVGKTFGHTVVRIPLVKSANIVHGNALRLDWNEVIPAERCSFVLGNPPFVGAKLLSDAQRADLAIVCSEIPSGGLIDFVAGWYIKAARYAGPSTRCAFVSTNSICQGEQVAPLWGWMLSHGIHIHFAHRTFRWSNEAKGVAAVHCVIVGFGKRPVTSPVLFDYDDIAGEPHIVQARRINPYLVDADDVLLPNRSFPLCDVPAIGIGNKPIDGGHYLFTTEERDVFLAGEPQAAPYFRRWIGSDEFINGWERWCLWLGECPPAVLRQMPESLKRVEAVRQNRLASKSAPTRKLAATPTRFHVENIPDEPYLVIPEVSSERRKFIPFGYVLPSTLASNKLRILRGGTLHHFGVLTSTMHMAWVRQVTGRLKSDFQYSVGIVYNNFPWPIDANDAQRDAIAKAAQGVLDARAAFPDATLADLYDPLSMPPALVKAHQALDRAVDGAYAPSGGKKSWASDAERVAFLFALYQRLTSLLPVATAPKKRRT
ncbi:MAG: DNA methyltransferase [Pseudomonadota bacterium]